MELVGYLTEEQKITLTEPTIQLVQPNWYFCPIQDINSNWIVSTEEMYNSIYEQNEWVKTLPLIEWKAPTSNNIKPEVSNEE
jgi:hypothetical protein